MALQIVKNINVDFYNNKYILINAKQYDDSSRWIVITCYNQGDVFKLDAGKHLAYVKYRKADGNGILNFCKINSEGEVLVELTEQMLAADGICYVDLVVINKGSAMINIDTGEIIAIDDSPILSTMAFCVNVYETPIDNSEIESSSEYEGLNELMKKVEADYTEVIMLSKSYAIGDAGGIRGNEDVDNAKYYCEQSAISADNAKTSETNSAISEANAKISEQNAKVNADSIKVHADNAAASEANAKISETNAAASEANAKISETNAAASEANAKISAHNAMTSEIRAATSEANAKISETVITDSANVSKSYAVGGTGTRENEDTDNAHYYFEMVKTVANGLNSGFIPIGTIPFSKLAMAERATGFTYNISDDFVTDDTFVEGAGKSYTAGTNVYYTASGYWDCFGGAASSFATVDEVKTYLGI